MLRSREFWSEGAYRAKVKSPLEMVTGAVRATGAEVTSALALPPSSAQTASRKSRVAAAARQILTALGRGCAVMQRSTPSSDQRYSHSSMGNAAPDPAAAWSARRLGIKRR